MGLSRTAQLKRKVERGGCLTAAERRHLDLYGGGARESDVDAPEVSAEPDSADDAVGAALGLPAPAERQALDLPSPQRASRSDIVDDMMRSASNAMVASLEMMERTVMLSLEIARARDQASAELSERLVDALTMLAERVHEERTPQAAPDRQADEVQTAVMKRAVDAIFPAAKSAAPTDQTDPT